MANRSFPTVKRSGRDADYSPPYSFEVQNEWSCTSTNHMPSQCDD